MAKSIVLAMIFMAGTEVVLAQSQTGETGEALIRCAKKAIAMLDDQISSAETVGYAALSVCRKEERALYAEQIRGRDIRFIRGFNNTYSPEKMFSSFVLRDRAAKKDRGTNKID